MLFEKLRRFMASEEITRGETDPRMSWKRKENTVVNIKHINEIGQSAQYYANKIDVNTPRLVGEIYTPLNPTEDSNIIVNWAGTYNGHTILADFEKSPGEESFRENEERILKQIDDAIKEHYRVSKEKVNLTFSGHSLGGGLAQLSFHALQKAIASKYQYINSRYINTICLKAWNSVGVLKSIEEDSNVLAKLVKEEGIHQEAYYGLVGGDFAQTVGEGSVLSNVDAQYAQVHMAKFDAGVEGQYKPALGMFGVAMVAAVGANFVLPNFTWPIMFVGSVASIAYFSYGCFVAHNVKHFENIDKLDRLKYILKSNNTPEEKQFCHQELTNKSAVVNFIPYAKAQVEKGLGSARSSVEDCISHVRRSLC